jgi:carbon-monoxide dehydrogenase medium subunit
VIQHRFDYRAPRAIDEALGILSEAGDECAVLGGGTWLIPNMTYAAHQPKIVLDPKHLGLSSISVLDQELVVGARASYADLLSSSGVSTHLPLLAKMAGQITGGISIVGQGTMGGSVCYANPSSDVPACLVALRARFRLRSAIGAREVDALDFFQGAFSTARRPDEMLTEIVVPKMSPALVHGYHKLKFSTGSWPIVTAAVTAEKRGDDGHFRVVLGAASAVPILSQAKLSANPGVAELMAFSHACSHVAAEAEWSDELAGPGYRRRVAHSIVLKALQQCGAIE